MIWNILVYIDVVGNKSDQTKNEAKIMQYQYSIRNKKFNEDTVRFQLSKRGLIESELEIMVPKVVECIDLDHSLMSDATFDKCSQIVKSGMLWK